MRVGVFDSGVGGLSILQAIRDAMVGIELSYCCDNKNFPYGTKTEQEVVEFASGVVQKFYNAAKPDVLVVACNTASTVALPKIRSMIPIPVVGVVPAVKPAAERSKSKIIGVLATPATVSRPYLDSLIHEFASDCRVIKCGSSELVLMAERKLRGEILDLNAIRNEVLPIIEASAQGLDQLVLGCTHFPLLAEELRRVLPPSVQLVDSGQAIAARVQSLLKDFKPLSQSVVVCADILSGWCSGPSLTLLLPGSQGKLILRSLP